MTMGFVLTEKGETMNKELAIECIKTQRQFVDDMTREAFDMAIDLIKENVAPVRHGMWVDVDRMQMHDLHGVLTWGNSFKCTECQFKTFAVEGHMAQYHYCPNCGARMDGEKNE